MDENIQKNLLKIKTAIATAEKKYGRTPGTTTLVAVSKSQPTAKIKTAAALGQTHFGENYLQEFLLKIKELQTQNTTWQNIIWHYIGRIQSNKIKLIAPNFAWVETVSSYEVAKLLNKYRPLNLPPLNVCIQVNLSKETSKTGVLIDEILPVAKKILPLPKLKLRGLMTIPASHKTFETQFKTFNSLALKLKELQDNGIPVDTLSMGMSEDFEAAIAAGATIIRIGTSIFGKRNS